MHMHIAMQAHRYAGRPVADDVPLAAQIVASRIGHLQAKPALELICCARHVAQLENCALQAFCSVAVHNLQWCVALPHE